MQTPPPEKKLETVSFVTQVTRGIIREPHVRRRMMAVLLTTAVLMLLLGSTVLKDALNPREHLGWFLIFWLACAWITLTALLLAVFDFLLVRAQGRTARKALGSEWSKEDSPGP